jgi:hypothetical protein
MSISAAAELCADLSEPATRQPAKKRRRSADEVALGVTHKQAKYERESLGGGSGSSHMLTGHKARGDPQQAYPATKKRAKTAVEVAWAEFNEWKKSSSLEVCSKTGAIVSVTWDRADAGPRGEVCDGPD